LGEGVGMNLHRRFPVVVLSITLATIWSSGQRSLAQAPAGRGFTIEDILSMPQPDNLIASPTGSTIGWTFNERGARNIYVADAPGFIARRITSTSQDDGQELTDLSFSKDSKTIVYVRGGDHGSSRAGDPPNPASSPIQPKIQVWSVPIAAG